MRSLVGHLNPNTHGIITPTHHLINTAKDAEMSISPTLIIPLLANDGRYFRVRTLLDSGSGTNWITRAVLQRVKHTIKGKHPLEVFAFGGSVKKKFTLVETYFHDERGKIHYIMCYVQDDYATHITVDGMLPHVLFNHTRHTHYPNH